MNVLRLCIILLLLAPSAFGRVLSYSSYSDRLGGRAYQSRTTRHFLGIEGATRTNAMDFRAGRIVVYDSTGVDAPRVVHTFGTLRFAALYQERADRPPMILLCEESVDEKPYHTRLSTDGGTTWITIDALEGVRPAPNDVSDAGGPWTHGLAAPVQIGNQRTPFVVSYERSFSDATTEAWAIAADGTATKLGAQRRLIGRNAGGTRFLATMFDKSLKTFELSGSRERNVAAGVDAVGGWITNDGAVYAIAAGTGGVRTVNLYRNGVTTQVAQGQNLIAIPTAGYGGAWILQHEGTGTVLLRHRPRHGLEKLWSVPELLGADALHAGISGQTLLIQRPRARRDNNSRGGVMVALWRVGEPAPAAWDELLGRMERWRGFVNLDVDAVAGGAPFVFDTSFTANFANQIAPGVPPPADSAGGADVIQEWGLLRASLRQRLVLPVVAPLTDVLIYNPLDVAQKVALRFESSSVDLTLAPREIRVAADILESLFDREEGRGPLYITPQHHVTVNARTYVVSGNGTAGYGIAAVDEQNLLGPRFPGIFGGAFPSELFRTNVFLTNLADRTADVSLIGSNATIPVAVPPESTVELDDVASMLGTRRGVVAEPTRGNVMASVVATDEITGDASYFPPDPSASATYYKTLPLLAHIDRPDGTRVRSDVYVTNTGLTRQIIGLWTKPLDSNQSHAGKGFYLEPNETRIIRDALDAYGIRGLGRMQVISTSESGPGALRVTSRMYTTLASGGTYGTVIPVLSVLQYAGEGESLEVLTQAGGNLRVTLNLAEMGFRGTSWRARIRLFDAAGKEIDNFLVTFPGHGRNIVIEDLFRERNLTAPAAVRIVIDVLDPGMLVGAHALVVDNKTGDPGYVAANLGGK
jgi:hypothetical protein